MELVKHIYDVIVVGSGPAGLSAALYASRSDLDTVILDQGIQGGQLNNTESIENFTGFGAIKGIELAQKMKESSLAFGAEIQYGPVKNITVEGNLKHVHTSKKVYQARAVVVATGSEHRELGSPGEKEFTGRGVSYCAVCDGAFFRNRDLVVVGGGDSAVEEGTYLTQFANKVTIIHRRDALRATEILQQRAFENDKVEFIFDSVVEEINGDQMVDKVEIRNVKTGETSTIDTAGVFVYVGLVPNTHMVSELNITNDSGWIITDENMETSVSGIFAAGDVRKTPLRQVATAVGDGSIAGQKVYDYIQSLND